MARGLVCHIDWAMKLKCIGCYKLWSSRSHEHGGRCCTDRHAELDLKHASHATWYSSRFPPERPEYHSTGKVDVSKSFVLIISLHGYN
jgi:hypothetical protein